MSSRQTSSHLKKRKETRELLAYWDNEYLMYLKGPSRVSMEMHYKVWSRGADYIRKFGKYPDYDFMDRKEDIAVSILGKLRELFKGTILWVNLEKKDNKNTEHLKSDSYQFKIVVKNMNKLERIDFTISEQLINSITQIGYEAGFTDVFWDAKHQTFVFQKLISKDLE